MKYLRSLFLLLAPLFLFSCLEEEAPAPENYFITQKDGVKWESEQGASVGLRKGQDSKDADSLFIGGHKVDGWVSMSIGFKGVGTYKLPATGQARYYGLVGGDVVVSSYKLDKDDGNAEIVITEWNPDANVIKGTFRFRARKLTEYSTGSPETVNFTQGEFQGKVNSMP
ncbi:DUF6252 family protein [Rufibacter tibetensis]|uniref:Lipoprotein n=1 Tax=Rufibacter tibetensis TaxID=512763 RepID=A0A0P0CGM5_9BACT|nr:DUF6252 family protein [Rufibacter tibetensis]ALI98219.1 hypothetical protein DC20_03515 [Rufibacter tibetensis]